MSKKIIKLNRSDSFEFTLSEINTLLTDKDVIYFALMYPHQPFEEAFLIKGFTSEDQDKDTNEVVIKITPNDTRSLAPGIYYYTVKLQRGGTLDIIGDFDEPDEVRTIIERTKFIINE